MHERAKTTRGITVTSKRLALGIAVVFMALTPKLFAQRGFPTKRPPTRVTEPLNPRAYNGVTDLAASSELSKSGTMTFTVSGAGSGSCTVRVYPGEGINHDLPGPGFPRQFTHTYTEPGHKVLTAFSGPGCNARWAATSVDIGSSRLALSTSEPRKVYLEFFRYDGRATFLAEGNIVDREYFVWCTAKVWGMCASYYGYGWRAKPQEELRATVKFAGSSGSGIAYAGLVLVRTSYPNDGWWYHWDQLWDFTRPTDPATRGQLAGWPVPAPWAGQIPFRAPSSPGVYQMWIRIFIPRETEPYFGLIGDLMVESDQP
jgi:hypothetical protein